MIIYRLCSLVDEQIFTSIPLFSFFRNFRLSLSLSFSQSVNFFSLNLILLSSAVLLVFFFYFTCSSSHNHNLSVFSHCFGIQWKWRLSKRNNDKIWRSKNVYNSCVSWCVSKVRFVTKAYTILYTHILRVFFFFSLLVFFLPSGKYVSNTAYEYKCNWRYTST